MTEEVHKKLLSIFVNHPNLTYQNKGYDTLNISKLPIEDKKAFEEAEEILRKHITGFSRFNHFTISKKEEVPMVRFQYDYSADKKGNEVSFTGVGYVEIRDFKKNI